MVLKKKGFVHDACKFLPLSRQGMLLCTSQKAAT